MFFRPVLVFLSCFSASSRTKGEIIKTAMRINVYVPTVLFELEGIQSRLDLPRVFAPSGVGGVALDQEANAVFEKEVVEFVEGNFLSVHLGFEFEFEAVV